MDIRYPANHINPVNEKKKRLKDQVKKIFISQNLDNHRRLIRGIASELKISALDCAAALAFLNESQLNENAAQKQIETTSVENPAPFALQTAVKLVRYRLDLGLQHNLNEMELKKVLVEESGVDIKNISNVRIQDVYTLIDLPDEMPQEIFHHLKAVEINGRRLDIRRVKPRNKKRNNRRLRQNKAGQQSLTVS